jgi:hypothetical protein
MVGNGFVVKVLGEQSAMMVLGVQSVKLYAGVNNTCTGAHYEALRARALNLRIKDQAGIANLPWATAQPYATFSKRC